ncbi:MAG: DUF3299 domain-containing protein [Steroidobacteraceae bacterium]
MNAGTRILMAFILALPALIARDASGAQPPQRSAAGPVRNLEWVELLPESEREGYIPGPPPPNHGYLDDFGSSAFGKFGGSKGELDCSGLARRFNPDCQNAEQMNMSSAVNESLDGQTVRLEGYIVPLELGPNGKITEFFLASYVGACIHVPPPPPNQMVYARVPAGQQLGSIYDAYAVTGVLHTHVKVVKLAGSAYTFDVLRIERLQ